MQGKLKKENQKLSNFPAAAKRERVWLTLESAPEEAFPQERHPRQARRRPSHRAEQVYERRKLSPPAPGRPQPLPARPWPLRGSRQMHSARPPFSLLPAVPAHARAHPLVGTRGCLDSPAPSFPGPPSPPTRTSSPVPHARGSGRGLPAWHNFPAPPRLPSSPLPGTPGCCPAAAHSHFREG